METLRRLFDAGALTKAHVLEQPSPGSFVLEVSLQNGQREYIEHCKTKQPKTYKSEVSAAKDAKRIGFKSVEITYI